MSSAVFGNVRLTQDNVLIVLEPLETQTSTGLHIVQRRKPGAKQTRFAKVLAVGPGHRKLINFREALENPLCDKHYKFVPTEVRPGDRVVVDAIAGQNYALDIDVPRHNKGVEFEQVVGTKGEFRIVREDEILGVVEGSPTEE